MRLNRYRIKRLLGRVITNPQSVRWVTQGVILARLWSKHVDSTKHCLDVGCGGGTYAIECFLKRGARTSLCEYEPALVDLTREQVAAQGMLALSDIQQASAYALPYADATFDCVECIEVLEHLEDPIAALREIRRVSKPGAVFVASTPHPPEWHENSGHMVEGYTREGITVLLEKAGWKVERVEVCMLIAARLAISAIHLLHIPLPLNPLVALENLVPIPWRKYLLPYDIIALARRAD